MADFLAFWADIALPNSPASDDDEEFQSSGDVCDLIGEDTSDLFHAHARQGLYLRLRPPRAVKTGKQTFIGRIERAALSPDVYGFKLDEYTEYEVPILYRVPNLIGKGTSLSEFNISATSSAQDIQLSSNSLPVVGNYGSKILGVTANSDTSPIELLISFSETLTAQDGTLIYGKKLSVPL